MTIGEIESVVIKVKGVMVDIHIDPDHDTKPQDADCYTPEDIRAWEHDEWRFVGVTAALHDCPSISVSLWGVEWGSAPGFEVDMSKIINEHPIPDMLAELKSQLSTAILALAGRLARWED